MQQDEDAISPNGNLNRARAAVQDETAELFRRLELYRRTFAGLIDDEQGQIRAVFEQVRRELDAILPRHRIN